MPGGILPPVLPVTIFVPLPNSWPPFQRHPIQKSSPTPPLSSHTHQLPHATQCGPLNCASAPTSCKDLQPPGPEAQRLEPCKCRQPDPAPQAGRAGTSSANPRGLQFPLCPHSLPVFRVLVSVGTGTMDTHRSSQMGKGAAHAQSSSAV